MENEEHDFQIDAEELKSAVRADILAAQTDNRNTVEEAKARISDLVNRTGLLSCCDVDVEDEDPQNVEIPNNVRFSRRTDLLQADSETGMRKKLEAVGRKSLVDMEVVRLMDKDAVRDTKLEMKAFYTKTQKIAENVSKEFIKQHKETSQEIEDEKEKLKQQLIKFTNILPTSNATKNTDRFENLVQGIAEKSAADFDKTNKKSQELTKVAKTEFNTYMNEVFPTTKPTPEQILSESFIKDHIFTIKDKVLEDFNDRKVVVDQLVTNTKTSISYYPEKLVNGVKDFSQSSINTILEKAVGSENPENIEEVEYNQMGNSNNLTENKNLDVQETSIKDEQDTENGAKQ